MDAHIIGTAEAASILNVNRKRVHHLIDAGQIVAGYFGRSRTYDRRAIEELAHLRPITGGKPIDQRTAWEHIKGGVVKSTLKDPTAADSLRRRLRTRATFERRNADEDTQKTLRKSDKIRHSGHIAATQYKIKPAVSAHRILGYINESDFKQMGLSDWHRSTSGEDWNVELGVIPDTKFPFRPYSSIVDPITLWLDLADHREGAAPAAQKFALTDGARAKSQYALN